MQLPRKNEKRHSNFQIKLYALIATDKVHKHNNSKHASFPLLPSTILLCEDRAALNH